MNPAPERIKDRRAMVRRIGSLARAEAILLRRSPAALGSALVAPLPLALLPVGDAAPGENLGSALVPALTAFTLMLGVYYNLVTALVARREESVLKRLRTGEISDLEIIIGTAAPAIAIAWLQVAIGAGIVFGFLNVAAPTNPALAVAGIVAGSVVCVLLAVVVTSVTSSVETAQWTATPLLVLSLSFSGSLIVLDDLPDTLAHFARALPLTPVVQLVNLGLTGTTADGDRVGLAGSFGAAAMPLLILGVWLALSAWAARRWFRWEPRR
jgi:ABC-2 type transport system permease protein